ncbi:unnamed protein product [Angiostrongylus costaricensis]|uniref:C3H1-type domain-containing protein n=1 Tax=Angiostrongylus costaricensis TaxID=334426 RepID=A0A158PK27_ANGCS|nr:unnamed protein product [Angiostrongylus costaricensis]
MATLNRKTLQMSRTPHEQLYYGIDDQARRSIVGSVLDSRQKGFHGQTRLITVTPDAIIPSVHEPIEAGVGSRRRKSDIFDSRGRRQCVTWETMTDEEREEVQRMKRKDEAFKTALCDAFKKFGFCPYGDSCRFAHGDSELRLPSQPRGKAHPKYKTQLCDKFSTFGHCPYGPRCQFIHKLKKGLPLIQYERLLAAGEISPEREDESNMRPASQISRRSTGSSPTRRLSFEREISLMPRPKVPNAVYPKMEIINIEKACKYAEDVVDGTASSCRRLVEIDDMRSNIDFNIGQIGRPTSMHSLSNRGMIGDIRCIPILQQVDSVEVTKDVRSAQKKKVPDLSLIKEEPEETLSQERRHLLRMAEELNCDLDEGSHQGGSDEFGFFTYALIVGGFPERGNESKENFQASSEKVEDLLDLDYYEGSPNPHERGDESSDGEINDSSDEDTKGDGGVEKEEGELDDSDDERETDILKKRRVPIEARLTRPIAVRDKFVRTRDCPYEINGSCSWGPDCNYVHRSKAQDSGRFFNRKKPVEETSWERGLREAREAMRRASKKREEPEFETKRLTAAPTGERNRNAQDSDSDDESSSHRFIQFSNAPAVKQNGVRSATRGSPCYSEDDDSVASRHNVDCGRFRDSGIYRERREIKDLGPQVRYPCGRPQPRRYDGQRNVGTGSSNQQPSRQDKAKDSAYRPSRDSSSNKTLTKENRSSRLSPSLDVSPISSDSSLSPDRSPRKSSIATNLNKECDENVKKKAAQGGSAMGDVTDPWTDRRLSPPRGDITGYRIPKRRRSSASHDRASRSARTNLETRRASAYSRKSDKPDFAKNSQSRISDDDDDEALDGIINRGAQNISDSESGRSVSRSASVMSSSSSSSSPNRSPSPTLPAKYRVLGNKRNATMPLDKNISSMSDSDEKGKGRSRNKSSSKGKRKSPSPQLRTISPSPSPPPPPPPLDEAVGCHHSREKSETPPPPPPPLPVINDIVERQTRKLRESEIRSSEGRSKIDRSPPKKKTKRLTDRERRKRELMEQLRAVEAELKKRTAATSAL